MKLFTEVFLTRKLFLEQQTPIKQPAMVVSKIHFRLGLQSQSQLSFSIIIVVIVSNKVVGRFAHFQNQS